MVCFSNFSKQKMTYLWNLQTCENLINLRAQYQNNFEYARNSDYADLWKRIAININEINNIQISARQCQNKWHSLIRGYNNIKRILNRDTRGARRIRNVTSPNRYDIQFYELMRSEFWLLRGNNSS